MFYIGSQGNQRIYTFSMSTAYDISTVTGNTYTSAASYTFPIGGMRFNNDGTKMYTTQSGGSGEVLQWSLGTAYDVSTATRDTSDVFTPTSNNYGSNAGLEGLHFSSDGTKLYLAADNVDTIYLATLSTAWDLSSATETAYYDEVPSGSDVYAVQDVYVHPDGTKLVTINKVTDNADMYDIGTSSYATSATWVNGTVNDELYTLQEALGAQSHNRMDKTQLDAVADANHFPIGKSLDLMIALRMDTAASTLPT